MERGEWAAERAECRLALIDELEASGMGRGLAITEADFQEERAYRALVARQIAAYRETETAEDREYRAAYEQLLYS